MQSPKLPVYKAGSRLSSNVLVTPLASVPVTYSGPACTEGIIVLNIASVHTNAVVHDEADNKGKRAIFEMGEDVEDSGSRLMWGCPQDFLSRCPQFEVVVRLEVLVFSSWRFS